MECEAFKCISLAFVLLMTTRSQKLLTIYVATQSKWFIGVCVYLYCRCYESRSDFGVALATNYKHRLKVTVKINARDDFSYITNLYYSSEILLHSMDM